MSPLTAIAPLSLLLIAGAYLLGSLSGRHVLARLRGADRGTESKEPRGFVALRIAFDVAKGALAVWLALRHAPVGDLLSVTAHGYLAACAALLGHVWPAWHRLRGGAPTSVLVGALLVLWPAATAAWLLGGLLVWLLSGYAGLSIVLGALCLPLLAWWGGADAPRLWFAFVSVLLLGLGQREHLRRLLTGTEPRFARARRLHRWRRR